MDRLRKLLPLGPLGGWSSRGLGQDRDRHPGCGCLLFQWGDFQSMGSVRWEDVPLGDFDSVALGAVDWWGPGSGRVLRLECTPGSGDPPDLL